MSGFFSFFDILFEKRRIRMKRYGYVRVSAKDQNPERQYAALRECGISAKEIYTDKMSGKNFARPAYQ